MRHMVFGVFPSREEAESAIKDIEKSEDCEGQYSVIMHEDQLKDEDITISESDFRKVIAQDTAIGVVGGTVVMGVMAATPIGLVGLGPLFMMMIGAIGGGFYGALAGALEGIGVPDRRLRELSDHLAKGKVLISVETEGMLTTEIVEGIFNEHGAIEAHRHGM